jgi:hypothetical protein
MKQLFISKSKGIGLFLFSLFLFFFTGSAIAEVRQSNIITGTVVDATNVPIIGANILEKGTTNGTISDVNGTFVLNISKKSCLEISISLHYSRDTIAKQ